MGFVAFMSYISETRVVLLRACSFLPDLKRHSPMTYVVTENCIKCKYTDCVEACPVDCFYEGPNFLVIKPEECIDCSLCVPACPAEAIYPDDELPEGQEHFLELNAELAEIWPNIDEPKPAPDDADEWNGTANKLTQLER